MLGPMKKLPKTVVRVGWKDKAGNFVDANPVDKPYVLRRPKGCSAHAPVRRFMRVKPRYQNIGGLLVMGKRRARGVKCNRTISPRLSIFKTDSPVIR
jgi:hypothetical protein